uniref:Chromo domain-containing protein n=1 Tax=Glossina pallidipes TaxID=7398 RepID=A0A1A9Z626_GLOPL
MKGNRQKEKVLECLEVLENIEDKETKATHQADVTESDEEYEVEKIIGHKKVRGIFHFLMRWKGFTEDDDTWEPEHALNCPAILEKYKKENRLNVPEPRRRAPLRKSAIKRPTRIVDQIIDYTEKKSGRVFRIRWKGLTSEHDTWEPEKDLTCAALIQKFMKRVKSQKENPPQKEQAF